MTRRASRALRDVVDVPADPPSVALPCDTFRAARAAVLLAASRDACRPVLCAVHVVRRDGVLTLEACDSYRLHQVTLAQNGPDFEALVPSEWFGKIYLPKYSLSKSGEPVAVVLSLVDDGRRVQVACDTDTWTTCTVAGESPSWTYPDTSKITGQDYADEGRAAVNPKYFTDAMKAVTGWTGDPDKPAHIVALNPLKPCRFEATRHQVGADARLVVHLMPVRVP